MKEILKSIDRRALGERLQAARKARGLTQQEVADRLQIARTTLAAIEKGERMIRPDELIMLGQLYNEPVNRLLRQEITSEPFSVQFRAALSQSDGAEVEQAIHEFQKLCEDYSYLETITASPLPQKYPSVYEIEGLDPVKRAEDVASAERNRLGLGDGNIANLKKILENEVGIRIFGMPLPSKIAGLFAYADRLGACIATNTKHPHDRQLMSIMHEYGHFLTSRTKADIVILQAYTRVPASERFADAFARFFLLPAAGLQRRFHDIMTLKKGNITPADLLALADLYSVSFQAFLFRLEELKLLPAGTWDNLKNRRFQVRKAQSLLVIAPKAGGGEIVMPYRYRALVVEAFNNGDVSEGQLAQLLRTDRVSARAVVDNFIDRETIDEEGEKFSITFENLSRPLTEAVEA
jgi:Zn-dependent peptidase ImmA (M78 family)/transcriptional regulator with XRE-family HTH domain